MSLSLSLYPGHDDPTNVVLREAGTLHLACNLFATDDLLFVLRPHVYVGFEVYEHENEEEDPPPAPRRAIASILGRARGIIAVRSRGR